MHAQLPARLTVQHALRPFHRPGWRWGPGSGLATGATRSQQRCVERIGRSTRAHRSGDVTGRRRGAAGNGEPGSNARGRARDPGRARGCAHAEDARCWHAGLRPVGVALLIASGRWCERDRARGPAGRRHPRRGGRRCGDSTPGEQRVGAGRDNGGHPPAPSTELRSPPWSCWHRSADRVLRGRGHGIPDRRLPVWEWRGRIDHPRSSRSLRSRLTVTLDQYLDDTSYSAGQGNLFPAAK